MIGCRGYWVTRLRGSWVDLIHAAPESELLRLFDRDVDDAVLLVDPPVGAEALVLALALRGQRFHYDFDGSYGREHVNPGGGKPFSSLGGKLSYQLGQRMLIEGRWQFFSSRQASGSGSELSSSGFARHTVGLFFRFVM